MCPLAQPQTKYLEIVEKLNKMLFSGEANEFELKRLKKEAENIKRTSPARSFTLLGMIACLEKDVDHMHSHHKNALHYSGDNQTYLQNYAVSLNALGIVDKAHEYALEAHQKDPKDHNVIGLLAKITNKLDMEDEFQRYIKLFNKLTGETHYLVSFPEDDEETLSKKLSTFDKLIDEQPDLIVKPDPKMMKLAEELIEGVAIN